MVLLPNDTWYGLTGADNTLNSLALQNDTSQISVTGWVWLGYSSSPGYVRSNFLGNIYAETYTINGASYTVSQSTVTVTTTAFSQGTQSLTIGGPSNGQIVTTTYTGYYGLMTNELSGQIITVNGLLAWGPPICVVPGNGVIAAVSSWNTYFGLTRTLVLIGFVLAAVLVYLFMKSNRLHL